MHLYFSLRMKTYSGSFAYLNNNMNLENYSNSLLKGLLKN